MIKFLEDLRNSLKNRNTKDEEITEVVEEEDTSYIVDEKMPLLSPMMELLDNKNITKGITFVSQNEKLYCCFEQECLSEVNQFILFKIADVYSNTIFFSDNSLSPNSDRLEYWNPDGYFDKTSNITMRCRNKKLAVLELPNDDLTILGTTIMIANCLQEQDPLQLKVNEGEAEFSQDDMERHNHYNNAGCPDTNWLSLSVDLNKENPLCDNPYASFFTLTEINCKEKADNMFEQILTGNDKKRFISFNMDKDHLEEVIKDYLKTVFCNINLNDMNDLNGMISLIGESNKQLAKKFK